MGDDERDGSATPYGPAPTRGPSWRRTVGEAATPLVPLRLLPAAPRLARAPRGDGHTVVDVPGWKAPEVSGWPIRQYLRALGYDTRGWGFGTNHGDVRTDATRLTSLVERLAAENGPVSLVGWSLGGVLSREVALRRPELVRRVITYGTPVVGGPSYTAVARRYDRDTRLRTPEEIERVDATVPLQVPVTAIWSRRDGIVAWPACFDRVSPRADHVEVRSTHLGMGVDPDVWSVVAQRLATPA